MTKNSVEIRQSSLDKFLASKLSTLIFVATTIIGVYMALTGLPLQNRTALQLQEQRILTQDKTIETITKTQQNDTQEVKLKVADLESEVDDMRISIEKLTTVIEERIPVRK